MRRLVFMFLMVSAIVFGQDQNATDVKMLGVKSNGSFTYPLVGNDGKMQVESTLPFTNGSTDAQALLDASNSVNVNIKSDNRYIANKTTSNAVANSTPQSIIPIAGQKRITIMVNDIGNDIWVKVGAADAGVDSGIKVLGGIIIDDCNTSTVVSYYASSSTKIAIIQE